MPDPPSRNLRSPRPVPGPSPIYHVPVSTAATHPGRSVAASETYRRWVPNALTASRLLIAAAFFVVLALFAYPSRPTPVSLTHPIWPYLFAAGLFVLAALTDAIDGPLARRWKVVSKFGRVMDPFADKVLVVGSFIMLAGPTFRLDLPGDTPLQVSGVASWMVVVILGRELLVTSIRSVMESDGQDFSAAWAGKAKMILQACVIPAILLLLGVANVKRGSPGRLAIDTGVWITIVVTVLSGIPYLTRALRGIAG